MCDTVGGTTTRVCCGRRSTSVVGVGHTAIIRCRLVTRYLRLRRLRVLSVLVTTRGRRRSATWRRASGRLVVALTHLLVLLRRRLAL